MTGGESPVAVALVGCDEGDRRRAALADDGRIDLVASVDAADADETDGLPDEAVSCVVVTADPARTRRILEAVDRRPEAVATVVAPDAGASGEAVAGAAVRAGATDYVPSTSHDALPDRVLEAVGRVGDEGDDPRSAEPDSAFAPAGPAEHGREQLERLNRINAAIRGVIRTLVEAPTRADVERQVCDRLVESELYCGAWIGERTGADDVAYRVGTGEAETYLDRLAELDRDDLDRADERPAVRTIQTGEPVTSNRLLDHPSMPDPLQAAAREDGVRSGILVPIGIDGTIYGVLGVLAGREDAFSAGERDALALLGEFVAFTIDAVSNRRLLFADSVVELELRVEDGDSFTFDLSSEYDCTCRLEWAGDTARGDTYQYVTVEGLDGETVHEAATDHDSIESCRLIHDGRERCTIEFRLHESGVRALADYGATIREITVADGVADCLVEVPGEADVRRVIDAFRRVYENAQLVARREVDRPVRTAAERRERLADRLTDRQLTTLRLAYYGGYFDWPRGSTGEEIADAMGVSPPTMHQHLRKAQRALLEEFFEEGSPTPN